MSMHCTKISILLSSLFVKLMRVVLKEKVEKGEDWKRGRMSGGAAK
jgi:hypothetical protein